MDLGLTKLLAGARLFLFKELAAQPQSYTQMSYLIITKLLCERLRAEDMEDVWNYLEGELRRLFSELMWLPSTLNDRLWRTTSKKVWILFNPDRYADEDAE